MLANPYCSSQALWWSHMPYYLNRPMLSQDCFLHCLDPFSYVPSLLWPPFNPNSENLSSQPLSVYLVFYIWVDFRWKCLSSFLGAFFTCFSFLPRKEAWKESFSQFWKLQIQTLSIGCCNLAAPTLWATVTGLALGLPGDFKKNSCMVFCQRFWIHWYRQNLNNGVWKTFYMILFLKTGNLFSS